MRSCWEWVRFRIGGLFGCGGWIGFGACSVYGEIASCELLGWRNVVWDSGSASRGDAVEGPW